jgi:predicted nicotinamide N-methyase
MYWPSRAPFPPELGLPKRAIARVTGNSPCPDSGYASAEEEAEDEDITIYNDNDLDREILRADPLERAFAIKWITGFISRSETWIDLSISAQENEIRTQLLDEITSLLSMFSTDHDAEEGGLTRSFSFPSPGGLIKVELNDAALLDDDHTSVGLQSWGSAIVLAHKICADPACFSLDGDGTKPLRVLELGAGTGMLSIVTAKILHPAFPPPVIIATDYHAEVLSNLSANVRANFSPQSYTRLPVMVHALDWENPVYSAPLDGLFDIVLAADVVYHPEHARLIKGCVERVLARSGTFWMIMAMRSSGRHEGLDGTVDEMFPDASVVEKGTLAVLERTEMERLEGVGRADENEYRLFKIGWKGASDTPA